MKGIRVGGVYFTVRVDAKGIDEGLSRAEYIIKQFQRKMTSIKIDPIFKGKSMEKSISYIKTAQKELDKTYDSWKGRISDVSRKLGTLKSDNSTVAEDVRKRTEKMIDEAEKFFERMDDLSKDSSKKVVDRLSEIKNAFLSSIKLTKSGVPDVEASGSSFVTTFFKQGLTEEKGLPEAIQNKIGGLNKLITDVKPEKIEFDKITSEVISLVQEIDKFGEKSKKVNNEYAQGLEVLGNKMREVFGKNTRSLYQEQLAQAKSSTRVLQEQEQALKDLAIKESEYRANVREGMEVEKNRSNLIRTLTQQMAIKGDLDEKKLLEINKLNLENLRDQESKLRKELELGLNVRKNSATLSQNLNEQRERGRKFTEQEIESLRRLNVSLGQNVQTFKERQAIADAGIMALEKNEKAVQNLQVRETELRREIALGINVEKNRAELFSNVNNQKQLDASITKEQIKANERLGLSLGKLTPSYREQLQIAAQTTLAEDRRQAALRELRIEAEKLKAEMKVGMDVDKKKIALYDNLNARMKLGEYVVASEREEWRKLGVELGRTEKSYKELLADARNVTLILEKQEKELKKLTIEETRLRTALQAGIDVKRNTIALSKNLSKQRELGAEFTKQQVKEIQQLEKTSKKLESSGGFGSKRWFMQRATWFLQLRVYWLAYRAATEAVQGAFEFEQEIVNVKAIAQATTEQFERLKDVALEVGVTTRFSAAEAAKAMVTLAQAGYSTAETLEATKDIAQLATATLYGLKESADLVTSITRAWGKTTEETKKIVDTLATATNVTRLNMSYLGTAMNYVAGIAPQLDTSLKDTLTLLGTLANRGMNASIASTSLRGTFAELLKPTERFKKQIALLGVSLEEVDPKLNSIFDILVTLKNAGWDAENSFRAFERRVAMGATVLIQNANTLGNLAERMYQVNRASLMAEENLKTVQGQYKQFKDLAVALAYDLQERLTSGVMGVTQVLKVLAHTVHMVLIPVATLLSLISRLFEVMSPTRGLQRALGQMRNLWNEIKSLNDEISSILSKLENLYELNRKINEAFEMLKLTESEKVRASIYKKIFEMAKEKNVLTDEEIEKYKELLEDSSKHEEIAENINEKISERINLLEEEKSLIETIERARRQEAEKRALSELRKSWRDYIIALDSYERKIAQIKGMGFQQGESPYPLGEATPDDELRKIQKNLEGPLKLWISQLSEKTLEEFHKEVEKNWKNSFVDAGETFALAITAAFNDKTVDELARAKVVTEIEKEAEEARRRIEMLYSPDFRKGDTIEKRTPLITTKQYLKEKEQLIELNRLRQDSISFILSRLKAEEETKKTISIIVDYSKENYELAVDTAEKNKEIRDKKIEEEFSEMKGIESREKARQQEISDELYLQDLRNARLKLEKEISALRSEVVKEFKQEYSLENKRLDIVKRGLEHKLDEINQHDASIEKMNQIFEIQESIRSIEIEQANIKYKSAILDGKQELGLLEYKEKLLELGFKQSKEELKLRQSIWSSIKSKTVDEKKGLIASVEREVEKNEKMAEGLALGEMTADKLEEINSINDENLRLQKIIIDLKAEINSLNGMDVETVYAISENEKAVADEAKKTLDTKNRLLLVDTKIKNLSQELEKSLLLGEMEATRLKEVFSSTGTILEHQRSLLNMRLATVNKQIEIAKDQEGAESRLKDLEKERLSIHEEIRKKIREQYLLTHPFVSAFTKLKDKAKEFNEVLSDAIFEGMNVSISGLSDILFDITGGFQEQEQEIEDLKGSLKGLQEEYNEALAEGNIERVAEIRAEMARLNDEIGNLENPLKQAGEMFRSWAKDVVDAIRKVINEWIAMQIVTGILKIIAGPATAGVSNPGGIGAAGGAYQGPGIGAAIAKGHGGILPQIKSFRKFSSGGTTQSSTLALLGDNPSKKELVIPSENIEKNRVSGYARDRKEEPIYVLNLLTKEDLLLQMSSLEGKRVILNTVYSDMQANPSMRRV